MWSLKVTLRGVAHRLKNKTDLNRETLRIVVSKESRLDRVVEIPQDSSKGGEMNLLCLPGTSPNQRHLYQLHHIQGVYLPLPT